MTPDHHTFTIDIDNVPVYFEFIRLEHQCYVWVGSGQPIMRSLFVAMPIHLNKVCITARSVGDHPVTFALLFTTNCVSIALQSHTGHQQ